MHRVARSRARTRPVQQHSICVANADIAGIACFQQQQRRSQRRSTGMPELQQSHLHSHPCCRYLCIADNQSADWRGMLCCCNAGTMPRSQLSMSA